MMLTLAQGHPPDAGPTDWKVSAFVPMEEISFPPALFN